MTVGFIWGSVLKLRDYYCYCFKYILLTEERRQGDLVVEFEGRGCQRKSVKVRQMDPGRLHVKHRKKWKSWINERNWNMLPREDGLPFAFRMSWCSVHLAFSGKKQTTTELQTWYFSCEHHYCHLNFPATCVWVYLEKKCHFKTVSHQIFSCVFDVYCTLHEVHCFLQIYRCHYFFYFQGTVFYMNLQRLWSVLPL